jgi:tRNA (uracil-5-)-methyltransferase
MEIVEGEPQKESFTCDVESSKESLSLRTGFSSEHFKIEINGIPKYFGANQVCNSRLVYTNLLYDSNSFCVLLQAKKMMASLHLKPHKVKQCGQGAKYMFVNFPNEEEREKAIAAIDGFVYKGKKLKAFKAK